MASCAQINGMVQAYVDGELAESERVIFEQHTAECAACAASLRKHKQVSALLFESFAQHRLRRSLHQQVLEHLPDMEPIAVDIAGMNWRMKHPINWWDRVGKWVPAAFLVLLIGLGIVIKSNWPEQEPGVNAVGFVVQAVGEPTYMTKEDTVLRSAEVESFVDPGNRYETGHGDLLMLALKGAEPALIKINEDTCIRVLHKQKLAVEHGEIWLDVGRSGRFFKVLTPDGGVVVFGTTFSVRVVDNRTTVTVQRGEVQVENEVSFGTLAPGEQVAFVSEEPELAPQPVDVDRVTKWTRQLKVDKQATERFREKFITSSPGLGDESAKQFIWVADIDPADRITAVRLYFEADEYQRSHCGYDIYVYDQKRNPLFKGQLEGTVFGPEGRPILDVSTPGDPIQGVQRLIIQVVPDFGTGLADTLTDVKAVTVRSRERTQMRI